ncbi:MAG: MFS transporter [Caldilineaceae bacterium]
MSMHSTEVLDRTARRITGTIFTTESLFSAAFLAAVTLQSINAAELGGGDQYAGIPSTISLLGRAAIAIPIGVLMDRAGRRPALLLGYLFGALGFAISAVAVGWSSFFLLCLGAGLAGVANGSSQQARYIASEVWPSDRRARIIGLIVFAGTIGAIFGPLLVGPAGVLAQQFGGSVYAGPYWVGTVLTVLAALLIFALLRPDPKELSHRRETQRQEESGLASAARPTRTIFGLPFVQLAVASMVVGQLVMTLIMVITPVHMHHLNHTTGEISLVFTAHTLGMFGFAWATGWLIDRLGSLPMIAYGAGLLIVASVMAPVAGTVLTLAVALFVLGLGWNFCFVAGSALLSNQLHYDERGRVQGTNELFVSLASGAGSLFTGVIFAGGGMLRVGAVGLAITLIFAVFATWRWRRQEALAAS